jgi:Rieske Fe-S protein
MWVGNSLALAGIPVLCCSTEEVPADSFRIDGTLLTLNLSSVALLRKRGSAARVVDLERGINLIVVRDKTGRFAALDRSCTHGGAQVAYNRRNDTVQCTSWGHSEFALDGAVLGGSARKPLRAFQTELAGNKLLIHIGEFAA